MGSNISGLDHLGHLNAYSMSSHSEGFCTVISCLGSLTMENMGKLNEYSDTKQALYPINYRYVNLSVF